MPQRSLLRRRRAHQHGKESTLLLCLMVLITKDSQKTKNGIDINRLEGFVSLYFAGHLFEDIEGSKHDLVILKKQVRAFHNDIPCARALFSVPKALNAYA